jgi:hypothetical protein
MLTTATALKGFSLDSHDGEIGKVKEFYFDDRYWTIRYLVADTGNWLTGRKVLISPYALGAVATQEQHIATDLTRKQIEQSPSLDSDKPVSRQFEDAYYGYYGWPAYWSGPYMWGYYSKLESNLERSHERWRESVQKEKEWDPHLRSTDDVSGRHIHAADGDIGHVVDFIIDDQTWAIRYLIVDTRNWWAGKRVLVSPHWIERVSWSESKVFVNLTRQNIKQSPEFTEASLLTRDYETRLHQHYNRQGYWVDEPAAEEHAR